MRALNGRSTTMPVDVAAYYRRRGDASVRQRSSVGNSTPVSEFYPSLKPQGTAKQCSKSQYLSRIARKEAALQPWHTACTHTAMRAHRDDDRDISGEGRESKMHRPIDDIANEIVPASAPTTIETSLYDLIASIHDVVGPEDDDLVNAVVVHLLNSGRVKFADDPRNIEVIFP